MKSNESRHVVPTLIPAGNPVGLAPGPASPPQLMVSLDPPNNTHDVQAPVTLATVNAISNNLHTRAVPQEDRGYGDYIFHGFPRLLEDGRQRHIRWADKFKFKQQNRQRGTSAEPIRSQLVSQSQPRLKKERVTTMVLDVKRPPRPPHPPPPPSPKLPFGRNRLFSPSRRPLNVHNPVTALRSKIYEENANIREVHRELGAPQKSLAVFSPIKLRTARTISGERPVHNTTRDEPSRQDARRALTPPFQQCDSGPVRPNFEVAGRQCPVEGALNGHLSV